LAAIACAIAIGMAMLIAGAIGSGYGRSAPSRTRKEGSEKKNKQPGNRSSLPRAERLAGLHLPAIAPSVEQSS
jgi:hypothetical protein